MPKIYIPTGKAVSLLNVSHTIGKVLAKNGLAPIITTQFYPKIIGNPSVVGVLFNYPMDPVFCRIYAGYYVTYKKAFGDRMLFYTTVEGKLWRFSLLSPFWKYVTFIANSEYTRKKLVEAELKVEAVVPHGIDFDDIEQAKLMSGELRTRREKMVGKRVVFGYVGSKHIRKNVEGLLEAVQQLNEEFKNEFILNLVCEPVETPENVYMVSRFGTLSYIQTLAFIHSCDFLVFPTLCEGFGLPLLEAMALGRIVLHCWFEPLSEISSRETNITWDYENIEEHRVKGGIIFELHKYRTEKLVKAMAQAIDLYINNRDEYEARCRENEEIAKKYDANRVYQFFVERLR